MTALFIAIIGAGCRFPGAGSAKDYWKLLIDGVDAVTEIPPERFPAGAVYDSEPGTPGKTVSRWGGFVDGIDQFDPYFFGISPREAAYMDPQQRLLIETAWEAMEDAGVVPEELSGGRTGAYIGVCTNDYSTMQGFPDATRPTAYSVSGDGRIAAGRIANVLGLNGPVLTVDTACSSSLVAVCLACRAMADGECDLAFAGGANVVLQPELGITFSQGGLLSPEGCSKAFDAGADGFVRGEGAGVVLLKPLEKALTDGDPIYAVIRGAAVNNDGNAGPFMAPSAAGQARVLEQAYRQAGVAPNEVQYVEAHGTGTVAGDPVEVEALNAVLGKDRPKDRPCLLGSVKTNIGHTEAAAGVAGLIKAALSIKHGFIPASLHYRKPNPNIPWAEIPFRVQREGAPWPDTGGPRLAGVNSFGISGTNAHIVLSEAPAREALPELPQTAPGIAQIVTLSAQSGDALAAEVRAYLECLNDREGESFKLRDISYTSTVRRTHHAHRLALVARTTGELRGCLEGFLADEQHAGMLHGCCPTARPKPPVFMFSGVGSQWASMGRKLYEEEPAFREALERCDDLVRRCAGWSAIDEINREPSASRLDQIDIMQPAIFSVQVALAEIWRSWGVEPGAVAGHSMGECTAAWFAGVLTLEEAVRIICLRARLMNRASGKGAMAASDTTPEEAEKIIAGYGGALSLAAWNSPTSAVFSGETAAIAEIVEQFERQDVFCRRLHVDVACHSQQMEAISRELAAGLAGLKPQPESLPLYSTVTGTRISGLTCDEEHWARNTRDPVRFASLMENLLAEGHNTFIEISPHPVLPVPIRQNARAAGKKVVVLTSCRRGKQGRGDLLQSLGALQVKGHVVDWSRLHPAGGRVISLPAYQWQRERYWFEEQRIGRGSHPLLGNHWGAAESPGTHYWETELDTLHHPELEDHKFQGVPLLPLAAYIEMVLAASFEVSGEGPRIFRRVELRNPLFLSRDTPRKIQLVLKPDRPGTSMFRIYSDGPEGGWTVFAQGYIQEDGCEFDLERQLDGWVEAEQRGFRTELDAETIYRRAKKCGITHGKRIAAVERVWCDLDRDDCWASVRLPGEVAATADAYRIHPALLDGVFQAQLAHRARSENSPLFPLLPYEMDELQIRALPRAAARYWCHATELPENEVGPEANTEMYDEQGRLLIKEMGHRSRFVGVLGENAERTDASSWLYRLDWEAAERTEPAEVEPGWWVIFADRGGLGQRLSALLENDGNSCALVSSTESVDYERLLRDRAPVKGIVHLWSLDAPSNEALSPSSLAKAERELCGSVLRIVQTMAAGNGERPALWLVTRGAKAVAGATEPVSLAQAPLLGLGRVIPLEERDLRTKQIDLDLAGSPDEAEALLAELYAADRESEVALRGGRRLVARLARYGAGEINNVQTRRISAGLDSESSYELTMRAAGVLDNLELAEVSRRAPRPGEVELQVSVAGLNFLDVLKALNMAPGLPDGPVRFGMECCGCVVAIGKGVEEFAIGDEVIAWDTTGSGCLRAFLTTKAAGVVPKPPRLTMEEAATVSVVYQTAWYALNDVARLRRGESVLIHSAAGGVGLAALQVARYLGLEVYATAGTPEKREYLKSLGVRHVMNSRTLEFADEVMEHTGGRGVDAVLNSLAGEAIPRGLSALATGGRFLEIGKRDIYSNAQLGLLPFQKNLTFSAIDLLRLSRERPAVFFKLAREVNELLAAGTFPPLPFKVFPIGEATNAFRHMAEGKHIGKVLVGFGGAEVEVAVATSALKIEEQATYLVTGGFGGLGLEVARWLVAQGARHLVLLGRHGATESARPALESLRGVGAQIKELRGDVSRSEDVARAVSEIEDSMPPLKGVIHCAGVLDDGVLQRLEWSQFESVFAPKMHGSWNLHRRLQDTPLDFFVLFSSITSMLGSVGQANYAAANAFLDSLAHYRSSQGLPALSINWGPWAEVGMAAAQQNRGARLAMQGIESIPLREGVHVLKTLLAAGATQAGVCPIDWKRWREVSPEIRDIPVLSRFTANLGSDNGTGAQPAGVLDAVLEAPDAAAGRQVLTSYLAGHISRVLKIPADRLDERAGLNRLGLDSLTAVELRNRIELELSISLPIVKLLQGPSLAELADWLYGEVEKAAAAVAMLSDEEVDRMAASKRA